MRLFVIYRFSAILKNRVRYSTSMLKNSWLARDVKLFSQYRLRVELAVKNNTKLYLLYHEYKEDTTLFIT